MATQPFDVWLLHDLEPGYRRELSGKLPGLFVLERYAISPSTHTVVFDVTSKEVEIRVYGPRESMVWASCFQYDTATHHFLKCLMFQLNREGKLALG